MRILQDGVERARAKLEYTSLGAAFCRDEFTVAELRRVYEIVWGTPLDPRNFHRKVTGADRFLVETGSASSSGGRPAQLYRRGDTDVLHPPMLRPGSGRPASRSGSRQAAPWRREMRAGAPVVWRGAWPVYCRNRCGRADLISPEDNDVHADATIPTDT